MKPFNRILLTGAAGALGSLLRQELKDITKVLRVTDIAPLGDLAENEEGFSCDLADKDKVMELTRDVDMLVHMGGVSKENTFDAILNANYRGFYNVFEGCRKNGVKRVVWASSNHAIGFYPRTQRIDASVRPRPDSNYGVSKVFGEGLAQYYWDKYDLETVSIRIGSCFPKPTDQRMLSTWLSYPDFVRLVKCSLASPRVEHTVVYGVSNNDSLLWDNHMAAHLGYRPQDNAEVYREEVEATTEPYDRDDLSIAAHGGGFAAAGHWED